MKILVMGSDGFVGSNFCRQARDNGHQVFGTDVNNWFTPEGCQLEKLDLRDLEACSRICRTFHPDAIIHTSRAPGGMWANEKDRIGAYQINVIGARYVAQCAKELGALFVYLSTDFIFSGAKPVGEKYVEDDEAGPVNYYGVTKWIGEEEVKKVGGKWLVVRPAHIWGVHGAYLEPGSRGDMDILDSSTWAGLGKALKAGKEVRLPDNTYQTATQVNHLVETMLTLVEKGLTGIFHVASRDGLSRYSYTKTAVEALGLESNLILKGDVMDAARAMGVPPELVGIIPVNTCLNVDKVEKALGTRMLTLEEGLAKMKAVLKG